MNLFWRNRLVDGTYVCLVYLWIIQRKLSVQKASRKHFTESRENRLWQALIWTLYAFGNWMLPPFVKIVQSFILMQTLRKIIEQGLVKFLVLFFFKKIVLLLANIEYCLNFQNMPNMSTFLGGVPTSYMSLFLPVCLSVCLSVVHHVSGTVHHVIIVLGTHE